MKHTFKLHNHLTKKERFFIEIHLKINVSISNIVKTIKRSKSTILREMKRNLNSKGEYFSQYAQKKYVKWQSNKYFFKWLEYKKFTKKFKKYYDKRFLGVEITRHKIITNHPNIKAFFVKQIYNWINSNKWIIQKKKRLRRSYRKGRKTKIGVFSKMYAKYRLPIWTRLNKVDNRTEFGHWEADLVLGKRVVDLKIS